MKDARASARSRALPEAGDAARQRVLRSAFALFFERGFAGTSMLDIATRARVSKRDLYAVFANKQALLTECVGERARGMQRLLGAAMPVPQSRQALAAALVETGTAMLGTVCRPEVLMIYRLAIAQADRSPEIGRILDRNGREANHRALVAFLKRAQAAGLIGPGDPASLAARYAMVLWGDLLVPLLLRLREVPGRKEIGARARAATEAIVRRRGPRAAA